MLIDWFTVVAQTINFLILVWLLKRYLYQPVLHAIDMREQRIAAELADAAQKQTQAQTERDSYQQKNQQFDQQRERLMQQAVEVANVEYQRLLQEAEQAADLLRRKRQQSLASEAQNLKHLLSQKAAQEVFAIARKTLSDMATTSLEQQVTDVFIRRLNALEPTVKTILTEALARSSATSPAILRSAFELTEDQKSALQHAINQCFSLDVTVKFETINALISGIELSANGQKLVWSIADYLLSLEQSIAALLDEKKQSKAQHKTQETAVTHLNDPVPSEDKNKLSAPVKARSHDE